MEATGSAKQTRRSPNVLGSWCNIKQQSGQWVPLTDIGLNPYTGSVFEHVSESKSKFLERRN